MTTQTEFAVTIHKAGSISDPRTIKTFDTRQDAIDFIVDNPIKPVDKIDILSRADEIESYGSDWYQELVDNYGQGCADNKDGLFNFRVNGDENSSGWFATEAEAGQAQLDASIQAHYAWKSETLAIVEVAAGE